MRRRVWSETLPHAAVTTRAVCTLLRDHRLEVALAVRPSDLDTLARTAATLADAGIATSLWPMVDDRDGRWFHRGSLRQHQALVAAISKEIPRCHRGELVLDHEPYFPLVQALCSPSPSMSALAEAFREQVRRGRENTAARTEQVYNAWVLALEADHFSVGGALAPTVLAGRGAPRSPLGLRAYVVERMERAAGLLPPAGSGRQSTMLYRSLAEGWSRGLIKPSSWPKILEETSRRALARFGANADISLGLVGPGALETEPIYRDETAFAEDLSILKKVGISNFTLFDLGGLLRRGAAKRWLSVLE